MTDLWHDVFFDLTRAIGRFEEMLSEPEDRNSYVKDATIQRFEFCVELFWKLFKKIAESEGHIVASPKGALQKAYTLNLIDDEKLWLAMMQDRNLTSHTYRELLANEIYHRVKTYFPSMKKAIEVIRTRYGF
jgi:nucleotidyltransferase substrate binding protein (TIGR01987 family)